MDILNETDDIKKIKLEMVRLQKEMDKNRNNNYIMIGKFFSEVLKNDDAKEVKDFLLENIDNNDFLKLMTAKEKNIFYKKVTGKNKPKNTKKNSIDTESINIKEKIETDNAEYFSHKIDTETASHNPNL